MSRLFLRGLPDFVGERELKNYLSSYGEIIEVKVLENYAFVEFQSRRDAADVLDTFKRQPLLGKYITIEFAHPSRKEIAREQQRNRPPSRYFPASQECVRLYKNPTRPGRYPVIVANIPSHICWQELKDFGRESGCPVVYCDMSRRFKGEGFIEYASFSSAQQAARVLDGKLLGGCRVRVTLSEDFSSSYRRDTSEFPASTHHSLFAAEHQIGSSRGRSRSPLSRRENFMDPPLSASRY